MRSRMLDCWLKRKRDQGNVLGYRRVAVKGEGGGRDGTGCVLMGSFVYVVYGGGGSVLGYSICFEIFF